MARERGTFPNETIEALTREITDLGYHADAYMVEAAKLPEAQQTELVAKIDAIQDDQEHFIALLKKLKARETVVGNKAASECGRITRLVPQRYQGSF